MAFIRKYDLKLNVIFRISRYRKCARLRWLFCLRSKQHAQPRGMLQYKLTCVEISTLLSSCHCPVQNFTISQSHLIKLVKLFSHGLAYSGPSSRKVCCKESYRRGHARRVLRPLRLTEEKEVVCESDVLYMRDLYRSSLSQNCGKWNKGGRACSEQRLWGFDNKHG